MSSASATSFSELFPELFPIIIGHLPLVYRPSTLLSLALTCHRLHDIVFPRLVYGHVRLVGEDQAVSTLNALIAKAELVTKEDIQKQGNPSPSHCIRHLCIDSSIKLPICTSGHSLNALQKLIDVDGLRHLSALTLQVFGKWDWSKGDLPIDDFLKLPPSFGTCLKTKCPNLKTVRLSYFSQEFGKEWIEPEIFSLESLTSIHLGCHLLNYPLPTINLSQLPPNLHTLELRLCHAEGYLKIDASSPGGLLGCVIPNLRTLVLDDFFVSDPASTNTFWKAHPGIERLEFWPGVKGSWFNSCEIGMLPNLKYLQCNVDHALVLLPQVSNTLIRLSLWKTYNAQGPYLLRVVAQNGILPALRSLGIQRESGNSPKPREGHRWREDENGDVSEADAKRPARQFDGNYIMSLSKAAPNLEELELTGTSDDTLDSITASLSRFPQIQRLILSGGIDSSERAFFARSKNWEDYTDFDTIHIAEEDYGKYAPETFDEAARDLADGCRTLAIVTMGNIFGELLIKGGPSAKIIREYDGGAVKEVKRIRAWGNIIGKEEEW
ncbi:hypothetical protein BDZ97DRAFT_1928947 [Flammula alnicola]|nr:hypothetical protein BDZ97DRAFT_1928947 [Flammula alnicola]